MENVSVPFKKMIDYMVYGTLMSLALGLVTSTTILSLSHILMVIPGMYFLSKIEWKNLSVSAWAFLGLSTIIALSVVFNQDVAVNGYKPLFKVKYFLFGFLMIAPLVYYFNELTNAKKIRFLIYTFCVATTVASIIGIIGMKTGYNYISMRAVGLARNAGLSGMVLNYAHNLAYFQIIVLGLIVYRKKIETLVDKRFLYAVFIINSIGLYLTYTRGAMLALIIGAPFYFFKNNKMRFVAIGAILVILSVSVYKLSGKSILRPASDRERMSQWNAALMAFKERPLLGYGYLNFEQHSVPIKKRYNLGELQFGGHAHNNFLEILATTGIIGFVVFLVWLFSWLVEIYKRNDLIAQISFPYIIVFVVSGLTQSTISLGVNLFFVMAAYSIGQATKNTAAVKL